MCLARDVPAPPSARGVRLASGRLTRSGRRHGGTESGFEVGLRAVSPTWSPLGRGTFFTTEYTETPFGRHRRRPEKSVLRTCRPCFRLIILILWGFIMLWGCHIGTLRSEVPYLKEKSRILEGIESTFIKSIICFHFSIIHILYRSCRWMRFLRSKISSEDVGVRGCR